MDFQVKLYMELGCEWPWIPWNCMHSSGYELVHFFKERFHGFHQTLKGGHEIWWLITPGSGIPQLPHVTWFYKHRVEQKQFIAVSTQKCLFLYYFLIMILVSIWTVNLRLLYPVLFETMECWDPHWVKLLRQMYYNYFFLFFVPGSKSSKVRP